MFFRCFSPRSRFSPPFPQMSCSFFYVSRHRPGCLSPRRRPAAQHDDRTADELSGDSCDMAHPFLGREDLNPWHPAFDFQRDDAGPDAPDGALGDIEQEDPPPPHASRTKGNPACVGSSFGCSDAACGGCHRCGTDTGNRWARPLSYGNPC